MSVSINISQQEQLKKCSDRISQLQADLAMQKARKIVLLKYVFRNMNSEAEMEREEILKENDELKQELSILSETTCQLNEVIQILQLRLKEVQKKDQASLPPEKNLSKMEPEIVQDQFRHQYCVVEKVLETEKLKVIKDEIGRNTICSQLGYFRRQAAMNRQKVKVRLLEKTHQEKFVHRVYYHCCIM